MGKYATCGISVLNPVCIEKDYLDFSVDYTIKHGFNHLQIIGPIHDPIKGNIDGMTFYKKYAQFNSEKDTEYIKLNLELINNALEKTHNAGVKTYMWHHELELPTGFSSVYPEVLNLDGDIEVSHPLVKDFLENKICDFFESYPKMDGIILTLHETKVPLLKLKKQKLSKVERVKYVTKILYDTCKKLGKELICRPFASIEEDYVMMTKAYEEISTDMVIMDKWTQFDWSLTLPHNKFFYKIERNPILVETDIFGEYFGKGRFPLMLKDHIEQKVKYCDEFSPVGFCSRIDRAGKHPFGDVNEVNLEIMNACVKGQDVDSAVENFFESKYPNCGKEIADLMQHTERILTGMIYLQGYYFSELSLFPQLNHSKNHFYFEMMRDDYELCSGEWFIPIGWKRGDIQSIISEKQVSVDMAYDCYNKLTALKDRLCPKEYNKLHVKFLNLKICAQIWRTLVDVFYNYAKYFELRQDVYKEKLYKALDKLIELNEIGVRELGDKFYCKNGDRYLTSTKGWEYISTFVSQVKESFEVEDITNEEMLKENLYDYVICGGGSESHKLKKEVNFSDTMILNGKLGRIPGSNRGRGWSSVNAHGWFSYEIKVRPNALNVIEVELASESPRLDVKITLDDKETIIKQELEGRKTVKLNYQSTNDVVRIRFDRLTAYTPCIHSIKVKN